MKYALFPMTIFVFIQLFGASSVFAQMDPSSSLLVRPYEEESEEPSLDSGRYTVRKNSSSSQEQKRKGAPSVQRPSNREELERSIEEKISREQERLAPAKKAESSSGSGKKEDAAASSPVPPITPLPEKVASEKKLYLETESQDVRWNLVELSAAANYMYVNSASSYWYRNYYSSGPGVSVDASVWITPDWGIGVSYLTTLSADIGTSPETSRRVLADHRYTDVGLKYRYFSSASQMASSVEYGLKFSEYQMIVPKSETSRTRLIERGPGLVIRARVPATLDRAWILNMEMLPRMNVKEESTALSLSSGPASTAYGLKIGLGHEFVIDRRHQVFWSLSHRVDKTVYEGNASAVDPLTGTAPSGVSVQMGVSLFEFGCRWGD